MATETTPAEDVASAPRRRRGTGRWRATSGLLATPTIWLIVFFVVPVVGLFVGFVVGVYAAEYRRVGGSAAWPSTKSALRAVGLSILIELAAATLAACVWVVGVVVT